MIIYKIENKINGKIYIGQTKQKIGKRIYDHIRKNKSYLGNALRKNGIKSFSVSIIDFANTREWLCDKEIFWINFYDCRWPKGYNLTKGGDGGDCCSGIPKSEEHKEKLRISNTGQIRSLETRINISNSKKGKKRSAESIEKSANSNRGRPHKKGQIAWNKGLKGVSKGWMKGERHSVETKRKISESNKGKAPWNKNRKGCFGRDTINKMSESARKRTGKDRFNYGKKMSQESINKMKETKRRNRLCRVMKSVQSQ